MRTAIDTNLLIILLRGKPEEQARLVAGLLMEYDRQGQLLICSLVWAELKMLIGGEKLSRFLEANRILVDWELGPDIWSAAVSAFSSYLENRRRSGSLYYCPDCGQKLQVKCPDCGKIQGFPRHVLPDFLIGAHALLRVNTFLTADKGIPGRYFSALRVVNPLDKHEVL